MDKNINKDFLPRVISSIFIFKTNMSRIKELLYPHCYKRENYLWWCVTFSILLLLFKYINVATTVLFLLQPIATDIPVTSLESSTYSLQSTPPTSEDNKDDRQQEEEASVYKEENQNEEEGDDREDEEVELEEEIEREMTYEEKKVGSTMFQ